jgi:hypothetical protein
MSDQPEPQRQIRIDITWPPDTYLNAEPANAFVFTEFGDNVCIAFGFVPPPPAPETLAQDGVLNVTAQRKHAFLFTKSTLVILNQELQKYINRNIRIKEANDDEAAADPK